MSRDNIRTSLEVFGLLIAAFVASIIGGALIAYRGPLWLDAPLTGLGVTFYLLSAGLFVMTGLGVQHLVMMLRPKG